MDPIYSHKRLWVCRLLTQFMFEDMLVISIDESNTRSDKLGGKSWKFNTRIINRRKEINRRKFKQKFQRQATLFNTDARVINLMDSSDSED